MKIVFISTDESIMALGSRTLSACLLKEGFETSVVLLPDEKYDSFHWQELCRECRDADLIGFSCMSHGVNKALQIKGMLKSHTKALFIAGGTHASLAPDDLISDFDLVCHGEGEDLILELARRIKEKQPFHNIPGLWVRNNGEVIRNPSIPLANRLDDYPIPDYDLTHQYIGESGRLVPMRPSPSHIQFEDFVVLGSRGCPHQCSYCSNQRLKSNFPWLKEVRHYSVGYLMEHLKRVHSLFPGIRSFWIEDDTFFAKESEAIGEFAKRYKNEVGKPFYVLISPWTYSEEKLKLLIDAGLYKIIMGIQSGSDNTNANIYNRVLSSERIMKIALSLNGYSGLKVCYDFIGLNPFEKQSDLIETIKFIRKLPAPFYIFNNNLAFYPGTRLYERAVGEGLDISRRLKHAGSHQGYILLKYEKMRHKIFHFLLLLLSGSGNIWRIGKVPRFLLSETSITLYRCMDNRISDWVVSRLSALLIYMEWKKMIKRLLGPRLVSLIKLKLYYKLKYRPQNLNVYV